MGQEQWNVVGEGERMTSILAFLRSATTYLRRANLSSLKDADGEM